MSEKISVIDMEEEAYREGRKMGLMDAVEGEYGENKDAMFDGAYRKVFDMGYEAGFASNKKKWGHN